MTLALYGKSKKRQGSLLLAALLAILVASIGGLAVITTTFAHHLESEVYGPTCQNDQKWRVRVTEGAWSDYREAVLTITDATTSVGSMRFTPYISNGSGTDVILDSGVQNAPVHTAGNVKQYTGAFSDTDNSSTNIDNAITSLVHSGGTTWDSNFVADQVFLWDSELFKITDRSGDGKTLTVERGHGDTSPAAHTSNTQSRWVRGALDGSPNTISWDLDGEIGDCNAKIIIKKVVVGAGADPATIFTADVLNVGSSSGEASNLPFSQNTPYTHSWDEGTDDNDDFAVTEDTPPANWVTIGKKVLPAGETQCPSSTAPTTGGAGNWESAAANSGLSGGTLNNMANGDVAVVCYLNQYNQPQVVNPGISKVAHNPAITGGFAFYDIVVDQPSSGATAINGLVIVDAKTDIVVDSVSPSGSCVQAPAGTLTCNIGTSDTTIVVKRAINASSLSDGSICLGGHIQNWLVSAALPTGTPLTITAGGEGSKVTTTVAADNSACEGSQTIQKSDAVLDGGLLKWTITLTNSYPIAKHIIVYDLNTSLVAATENGCTGTLAEAPADYYDCEVGANSGASFVLSTTYPGHANTCIPLDVSNTAYIAVSNTAGSSGNLGSDSGTYHENASSAGCITWKKTGQWNPSVGDNHIDWYIDITNNSAVAGSITITDTNTSYVNSSCSNHPNVEIANDTYKCDIGAGPGYSIQMILRGPAITGVNLVCDNYVAKNTAVNAGNQNDSQTAEVTHYAAPDKSCISVVKEKSDTSQPPTWNIKVTNTADTTVSVYLQDDDAFITSVSGGNCGGDTILGNGTQCTVDANSTLILSVFKPYPSVATCEGTDVSNSVKVWFGTHASVPGTAPDYTADGGTHEDLNKDTSLCDKAIQINKYYYNLNGYAPVAADRPTFKLSPNPFGAGDYTIDADNDGNDAHCVLSGTNPFTWTCTVPAAWVGTGGVSETLPANWDIYEQGVCGDSLLKDVSGLVREVLSVLEEVKVAETYTFCNQPVGKITVIKIDNTSDANTGLPLDWDFRVLGSDSFEEDGSINLGGGQYSITAPLANGYTASELSSNSADECPIDGPSGIHGYVTTNIEDGPLNITQPGQEITFVFRNDDCGAVLGTGELHVRKVKDINGNHVLDGSDSFIVYQVRITGPEFPLGQIFNTPVDLFGITEGAYQVEELVNGNYTVIGLDASESGFSAGDTSVVVTVANNESDTVTFYNQPKLSIHAHKFAYTSLNGGANVPALNDDDGWTITVTSVNCGINQSKPTDSNGDAEFNNLPYCTDYVVSENPVNASSPGFVPASPVSISGVTPTEGSGTFVTFSNVKSTDDRPTCTYNCSNIPTPTPSVPTATPTTKPGDPTATPVPPTATPTTVSVIQGEKTPGPGSPTPIAPSTGAGVLGGTAGGFNLILILGGLLALTSGLSFMALGRKNRR